MEMEKSALYNFLIFFQDLQSDSRLLQLLIFIRINYFKFSLETNFMDSGQ